MADWTTSDWATLVAVYFITWWLALFIVLPFGVRTQDDEQEVLLGTPESAPVRPLLVQKAIATSIVAAVIVAGLLFIHLKLGVTVDSVARQFGAGPRP